MKAAAAPDIMLVALGIPAQEKLIYKHLNKFKKEFLSASAAALTF